MPRFTFLTTTGGKKRKVSGASSLDLIGGLTAPPNPPAVVNYPSLCKFEKKHVKNSQNWPDICQNFSNNVKIHNSAPRRYAFPKTLAKPDRPIKHAYKFSMNTPADTSSKKCLQNQIGPTPHRFALQKKFKNQIGCITSSQDDCLFLSFELIFTEIILKTTKKVVEKIFSKVIAKI